MKLRPSDPNLVHVMAAVLRRYEAAATEGDTLRCLVTRFAPLDIALLATEARALALAS